MRLSNWKNIINNDQVTRLIFADWLEEHEPDIAWITPFVRAGHYRWPDNCLVPVPTMSCHVAITAMAVDANSSRIVVGYGESIHVSKGMSGLTGHLVYGLYNANDGTYILDHVDQNGGSTLAVAIDSTLAAAAGRRDTIMIWDTNTGKLVYDLPSHSGSVYSLSFNPDGDKIAIADDTFLNIFSIKDGTLIWSYRDGDCIHAIAHSPDGSLIACNSCRNYINVFDTSTMAIRTHLYYHTNLVRALVFTPDNGLISCGADGRVIGWGIKHDDSVMVYEDCCRWLYSVVCSPNGRTIAVSGMSNDLRHCSIRLYDVATGCYLATIDGHTGHITNLAFNNDGTRLFSSSLDSKLSIWDVKAAQSGAYSGE